MQTAPMIPTLEGTGSVHSPATPDPGGPASRPAARLDSCGLTARADSGSVGLGL